MNTATEELLIEPVYLTRPASADAALAIVRCVAPWAGRYRAWQSDHPTAVREGELPGGEELESLLRDLFRWGSGQRDDTPGNPRHLVLLLHRGQDLVLAQVDAQVPERIFATREQFNQLQSCLRQAGLPADLFYPKRAQRHIVEPVEVRVGPDDVIGVVRAQMTYSPHEWARRDEEVISRRRLPTEEERQQAFAKACDKFLRALHLRLRELAEPGRQRLRGEDQSEVELALEITQLLMSRSLGQEAAANQFRANLLRKIDHYRTALH